ncbi:SDR family NAD(P)-dependent oxidoreductase [Burkholderia thailandensis]|uniref:SDR family NAD(P)-dependent oxidoreductase n=1 Tax=Burkholderia thailandensis TaxID=57975 RepID=UPI001EE47CAD|nr:SDR family NAD(P)-dependent oxidoreductase [Burkholderia thailandensis]
MRRASSRSSRTNCRRSRSVRARALLQVVAPASDDAWDCAALAALLKTAAQENPRLVAQWIAFDAWPDAGGAAARLRENASAAGDVDIRYLDGRRHTLRWAQTRAADRAFGWRANGVFLITGGAGGLGAHVAATIARGAVRPTIVIAGRSAEGAAQTALLDALRSAGARAQYRQADVASHADCDALIAGCVAEYGALHGVVHCAGVIRDGFIVRKRAEDLAAVCAPKVAGVVHLDAATRRLPLDFLLCFSSAAGALGNVGQSDYAMANAFMDAFAAHRNTLVARGQRRGRTCSIGWPIWRDGGMRVDDATLAALEARAGMLPLAIDEGMRTMQDCLALDAPHVIVAAGHLTTLRRLLRVDAGAAGGHAADSADAEAADADARAASPAGANAAVADAAGGDRAGMNTVGPDAPGATALAEGQAGARAAGESAPGDDVAGTHAASGDASLAAAVAERLKHVLSEATGIAVSRLDADEPFDAYGVDSVVVMTVNRALDDVFDALSQTLLYEYGTLGALAGHLAHAHEAACRDWCGVAAAARPGARDVGAQAQRSRAADVRVRDTLAVDMSRPDVRTPDLRVSDARGFDERVSDMRDSDVRGSDMRDSDAQASSAQASDMLARDTRDIDAQRIADAERQPAEDGDATAVGRAGARAPGASSDAFVGAAGAAAAPAGRDEPIAIIGIAGRYPQASDLDQFWRNLAGGVDSVTTIPPGRWPLEGFFEPDRARALEAGKSYGKWGAFLDDHERFDAPFFQMSPLEAINLDPQIRLFIETCWAALEDAGYTRRLLAERHGKRVGVFAGITKTGYALHGPRVWPLRQSYNPQTSFSALVNRVSYVLDLHGPSVPIDTMCSSSLTAVHEACEHIRSGACALALAGGVNLYLHPSNFLELAGVQMLSADGRCKSFGQGADGFVPGEGVGAVLLKPLSRALADGDHVHAVIRATGINHGGKVNGFTVPNPNAQRELIRATLERAGVRARRVSYVEAHGTGTDLGDPIEVAALAQAFAASGGDRDTGYCALGSVKSNIGHLEAAAGIAGLTKVVLQMTHGMRAPTLHARIPNEKIPFARTPFVLQRERDDWPHAHGDAAQSRIATVSSFGAGGANAFAVVEEAPRRERDARPDRPEVIVLSARDADRLAARIAQLRGRLREGVPYSLAEIAYTLQAGREAMAERIAFVADSLDALVDTLDTLDTLDTAGGAPNPAAGAAAARVHRGSGVTRKTPLSFLADDDLADTVRAWLAKGKLDLVAQAWASGVDIDWTLLHGDRTPRRASLPAYPFAGERHALPDAAQPVAAHALHPLLQRNTSTLERVSFASVFGGDEAFLRDHRVSGRPVLPAVAYIEIAYRALREAGVPGDAVRLTDLVWMRPAIVEGEPLHVRVELASEASEASEASDTSDTSDTSDAAGDTLALTIGAAAPSGRGQPGFATVFARARARRVRVAAPAALPLARWRAQCGAAMTADDCYRVFERVGLAYGPAFRTLDTLWRGDGVAVAKLRAASPPAAPHAAADVVDSLDCGLLDGALQAVLGLAPASDAERPLLPFALDACELYGERPDEPWCVVRRTEDARVDVTLCGPQGEPWIALRGLVLRRYESAPAAERGLVALAPQWRRADATPVAAAAAPAFADTLVVLCGAQRLDAGGSADRIRVVTVANDATPIGERFAQTLQALIAETQALLRDRPDAPALLQVVVPDTPAFAPMIGLAGFLRTLSHEAPHMCGQLLLVPAHDTGAALRARLAECAARAHETVVRYGQGPARDVLQWREWADAMPPADAGQTADAHAAPVWRDDGVYLVTGGAGGLAWLLAQDMARRAPGARMVLVGRRPLDARAASSLDALRARIEYVEADCADADAIAAAVASVLERHGRLDGVVHAAGVLRDEFIRRKTADGVAAVLRPKVDGTLALDRATRDVRLAFFVLFSSAAAQAGNPGQADYAAANGFMDGFAQYRRALVALGERHGATTSIDWPLWRDGGMRIGADAQRLLETQTGMSAMPGDAGLAFFHRAVRAGVAQVMPLYGNPARLRDALAPAARDDAGSAADAAGASDAGSAYADAGDARGMAGAVLIARLRDALAAALGVARDALDAHVPVGEFGVDRQVLDALVEQVEPGGAVRRAELLDTRLTLDEIASRLAAATRGDAHAAHVASPRGEAGEAQEAPQAYEAHGAHEVPPLAEPRASELVDASLALLTERLADVIKLPAPRIDPDAELTTYGIDSVVVMQVTTQLEKQLGPLSKTLFFEYGTLRAIAARVAHTHRERVRALVERRAAGTQAASAASVASHPAAPHGARPAHERRADADAASVRGAPRAVAARSSAEVSRASATANTNTTTTTTTTATATATTNTTENAAPHASRGDRDARPPAQQPPGAAAFAAGDIAIVGIAGRYPQADDLAQFWRNLARGVDSVTEIPADRWDYRRFYDPQKGRLGKSYSKWGGFLSDVARFDAAFFNISAREAQIMDPQERLFLECVYHTLEDAGYTRRNVSRSRRVGVFVGVMYEEYQLYGVERMLEGTPVALAGNPAAIANRVSYFCDFHGPSMAIDTMCSSSLSAIHLACQSLMLGECEVAVAGGVNVSIHPNKYQMLSQGRFASSNGRCESFGAGGDGYVPSEGVGAVLLKPLARAIADGDRIHAVIKATALNHGGKTNGYTVPNPNAQADVIGDALARAGIDARSIGYVEAHGTGTSLGDPIEIAGLAQAFGRHTPDKGFCAIGSVKSNIGHGESAAGMAGLTKIVLQMRHRRLVPSLHADTPNPNIDFADTPFVVQTTLAPWRGAILPDEAGRPAELPLRAGLSSFGAGGANAHVVVEAYDVAGAERGAHEDGPAVVVLSARTDERLAAQARNLLAHLSREPHRDGELDRDGGATLASIAYTLQVGREAMPARLAVIAASLDDLREKLAALVDGGEGLDGVSRGRVDPLGEPLAPGELAQWRAGARLAELAAAWVAGRFDDWTPCYGDVRPARVSLPGYAFAPTRYWVPDAEQLAKAAGVHADATQAKGIAGVAQGSVASGSSGASAEAAGPAESNGAAGSNGSAGSAGSNDAGPGDARKRVAGPSIDAAAPANTAQPAEPAEPAEPAARRRGGVTLSPPAEAAAFDLSARAPAAKPTVTFAQPAGRAHEALPPASRPEESAPRVVATQARRADAVSAAPAVSPEAVVPALRALLADALYVDAQTIDANAEFVSLGVDSIIGVEWIDAVNRRFGVALSATTIYDHPTLSSFARHLASAAASAQASMAAAASPSAPASGARADTAAPEAAAEASAPFEREQAARARAAAHGADDAGDPAPAALEAALRETLADALFADAHDIEPDATFQDLGVDSIIGVEWVQAINRRYGTSIPAPQIYQYPTLRAFGGLVASELALARRRAGGAPLPDAEAASATTATTASASGTAHAPNAAGDAHAPNAAGARAATPAPAENAAGAVHAARAANPANPATLANPAPGGGVPLDDVLARVHRGELSVEAAEALLAGALG